MTYRAEVEEALLHLDLTIEDEEGALTLIELGVRLGLEAAAELALELREHRTVADSVRAIDPTSVLRETGR